MAAAVDADHAAQPKIEPLRHKKQKEDDSEGPPPAIPKRPSYEPVMKQATASTASAELVQEAH